MSQDYLLRLIEQVARMLAAILAHQRAGRTGQAAEQIHASCQQFIGLPFDWIRRQSPEVLWDVLGQGGGLRCPRAILLAELLLQDAELNHEDRQPSDAIRGQVQAFYLMFMSLEWLNKDDAAVYRSKVESLANRLEALSDEPYIRTLLKDFRHEHGTAGNALSPSTEQGPL